MLRSKRPRRAFLPALVGCLVALAGCTAPLIGASTAPAPVAVRSASPASTVIRAAFYYPWFPEAWTQLSITPYTNYHPSSGYYNSADSATVSRQIADMQYAGMQAGISSWWGQGTYEDKRLSILLAAGAASGFRWAPYYEREGTADPTVKTLKSDLSYISRNYTSSKAYLRIAGKPVIFVYAGPNDGCGMATRWAQANTYGFYVVLKVFPGYQSCSHQPQGWHQYSPAVNADQQGHYSYSVSPGFWLKGAAERLPRDATRFASDVARMASSGAQFQLVTTYNEWGEGTAVESAQEWNSPSGHGVYADILHKYLNPTG